MITFDDLRGANAAREHACFPHLSPDRVGIGLAGETGEALNKLKKLQYVIEFGESHPLTQGRGTVAELSAGLAEELADVVCYADILAGKFGINLGDAVREKFNAVSERIGSATRIPPRPACECERLRTDLRLARARIDRLEGELEQRRRTVGPVKVEGDLIPTPFGTFTGLDGRDYMVGHN